MKVDTLNNIVDSLTKSISIEEFSWCRGAMGIATLNCWLCNPQVPCMQRKKQVGECWVCVICFARLAPRVVHYVKYVRGVTRGWSPQNIFWAIFSQSTHCNIILVKGSNLGWWIRFWISHNHIYCIVNYEVNTMRVRCVTLNICWFS